MDTTNSRGLHLDPTPPTAIPTSHPPHQFPSRQSLARKPSSHPCNTKRKPPSVWADQVDECKHTAASKKQRLTQIMNWPTSKPKSKPTLSPRKHCEHKDGDKLSNMTLVALGDESKCVLVEDEGNVARDAHSCDTQSCDSHSAFSSDAMSCDTLSSCDSNFGDHEGDGGDQKKKKKKKNKKKRKLYSAAEEGKKVFVGGIKFEDCDAMLSNHNETLETLRHQKFTQMFYLFGAVNRIQGHWNNGAARLAIKCLSFAAVRRKAVQNLQDNIAPTGVLPLPSFYVRWASTPSSTPRPTPTSSPLSSSPLPLSSSPISISPLSTSPEYSVPSIPSSPFSSSPISSQISDEGAEEIEWLDEIKEENMGEKEVERLMQELLTLRD